MAGLQEAQVESMRRLTAGLTDAIGEAQLTLQVGEHASCSSACCFPPTSILPGS